MYVFSYSAVALLVVGSTAVQAFLCNSNPIRCLTNNGRRATLQVVAGSAISGPISDAVKDLVKLTEESVRFLPDDPNARMDFVHFRLALVDYYNTCKSEKLPLKCDMEETGGKLLKLRGLLNAHGLMQLYRERVKETELSSWWSQRVDVWRKVTDDRPMLRQKLINPAAGWTQDSIPYMLEELFEKVSSDPVHSTHASGKKEISIYTDRLNSAEIAALIALCEEECVEFLTTSEQN